MTAQATSRDRPVLYGIEEFSAPFGYGVRIMAEIAAPFLDRKSAVTRRERLAAGVMAIQADCGAGLYQETIVFRCMGIVASTAFTPLVRCVEQVPFEPLFVILVAAETERWRIIDEQVFPVTGMWRVAAQALTLNNRNVARFEPRNPPHIVVAAVTEFLSR